MKIDKNLSEDLEKLGTNGKLRRYIALNVISYYPKYIAVTAFMTAILVGLSGGGEGVTIYGFTFKPISSEAGMAILGLGSSIVGFLSGVVQTCTAFYFSGNEEDKQKPKEEVKQEIQ